MIYYYNISYDEKTDTFYAYIDGGEDNDVIFTIDTTYEVCKYIKSGIMNHIDDIDNLELYLIKNKILNINDTVLIRENNLW